MKEKLKKLKHFTTVSFAVWPFDPKKDTKKIHSRIVIIGLNPSAKVKFGENFHKEGHQFDKLYKKGFSKLPFVGSFMTDLIFHHEPNSKVIIKKWKKGEFRRKNIRNLERQFKILGVKESTPILCIGRSTEKFFSCSFPKFRYIFGINHPNSYRMNNNRNIFLRDLKKAGEKITRQISK